MKLEITGCVQLTTLLYILLLLAVLSISHKGAAAQSVPSATLRSAALVQQFDFVTPDSLAFAIADITGLAVPLTMAPRGADGSYLADKLAGFQVLVAGRVAPIFSVEASAATGGTLRIGIYVPVETPLGINNVSLEIKRDDGVRGAPQLVAQGMLWIEKASPNLFVVDGYIDTSLVSLNGTTWMKGRARASEPEVPFDITGTANVYSASQETRVVIFGTGLRNGADTDVTNNPPGYKNVAESFEVIARFSRYIDNKPDNYAGEGQINLPIEYIGPVKGAGLPGIDQIVFRLSPELKQCVLMRPSGPHGEVDISLRSIETNESSEVNGSHAARTGIFVK
ncbi:MAG: hypothetical protein WKF30_17450 [Pyrinomonadaceae bacterium]